jgi:hypothetical protein
MADAFEMACAMGVETIGLTGRGGGEFLLLLLADSSRHSLFAEHFGAGNVIPISMVPPRCEPSISLISTEKDRKAILGRSGLRSSRRTRREEAI